MEEEQKAEIEEGRGEGRGGRRNGKKEKEDEAERRMRNWWRRRTGNIGRKWKGSKW